MAKSKKFDNIEERDRFIEENFPNRKCGECPGYYDLPNGGFLSVFDLEIRWRDTPFEKVPYNLLTPQNREDVIRYWCGFSTGDWDRDDNDVYDLADTIAVALIGKGKFELAELEVQDWWDDLTAEEQEDILPTVDVDFEKLTPFEKASRKLHDIGINISPSELESVLRMFSQPEAKDANSK